MRMTCGTPTTPSAARAPQSCQQSSRYFNLLRWSERPSLVFQSRHHTTEVIPRTCTFRALHTCVQAQVHFLYSPSLLDHVPVLHPGQSQNRTMGHCRCQNAKLGNTISLWFSSSMPETELLEWPEFTGQTNTFWLYSYIVPKLSHMNSKVISSIPASHSTHATEDCQEWLSGDQMLLFLDFVCIIAL